jgi:NAD+ kinase
MSQSRSLLLVIHPTRAEAQSAAQELVNQLQGADFTFYSPSGVKVEGVTQVLSTDVEQRLKDTELAVVFGGDGTILRGAELVRGTKIPVLGINVGHVGFLAQIHRPTPQQLAQASIKRSYASEKRMVLQYAVHRAEKIVTNGWALNEIAVERNTEAMVELFVQIDHRPLSRWGCDGVICATPTGSTAYAFSAGGPVVWPEVEALVLLPLAAHALFSRPMVISPESEIAIDIESDEAVLSADGLRKFHLTEHDRVTLTSHENPIYLAQIEPALFTDRLVAKFKLPVEGWRGE